MRARLHALLFWILVVVAPMTATPAGAAERWPLTVIDALGREVTIRKKPEAILLGSGFNLVALSLIHPDPVSLLAGWSDDMKKYNAEFYQSFVARFPKLADLPIIGDGTGDGLSFEKLLSLKADLALMANWQAQTERGQQAIEYLDTVGVPVVVIDFSDKVLEKTPDTMRLLGRLLERDEQAQAYAAFYEEHLQRIRSRVAAHPGPGPTVLMNAFPDPDRCCYAFGTGGLGEFITLTGSSNIAKDLPRMGGMVNDEFVMAQNPEVYIATASPGGGNITAFSIGPGVSLNEARGTLAKAVGTSPVLETLDAVRNRRVYGLWNFFNAVPINILAAEAFAAWLRPDLFPDIDPSKTLDEINERFAAVPFEGTYWIDLGPHPRN